MNLTIRIISFLFVCFASYLLVFYQSSALLETDIRLTVLLVALVLAFSLLFSDVVNVKKRKLIKENLRVTDYALLVVWPAAILATVNDSSINRTIHSVLDLQRNLTVFRFTEWLVVMLFVVALGVLFVSIFLYGRLKARSYSPAGVTIIIMSAILVLMASVPLDKASLGSCGGLKETHVSLLFEGREAFDATKQQAKEQREEERRIKAERRARGDVDMIVQGCSPEPIYTLYIL